MLIHLALLVAQAVAPVPDSVLGEVSEIRAERLALRTDAGGSVTVETSEKTTVLRTQPGATTLAGAVPCGGEAAFRPSRSSATGSSTVTVVTPSGLESRRMLPP